MENLKENIEKMKEFKKDIYKVEKQIDLLVDKSTELYHKNYEEYQKNDNKIKQLKKKIKLNNIKIAIIKNNLHYLLKMDFEGIKEKMLDYYENKQIGEKTKEKMRNEIKEYFKNNFNVNIACYIYIEKTGYSYKLNFSFGFLDSDGYNDYTFKYGEDFKITFEKRKYNNYELVICCYYNINDYIELKDLSKKASELFKEYNKTKEKIEKLHLQQKELYHNFSDFLNGSLYDELKIKTDLRIY